MFGHKVFDEPGSSMRMRDGMSLQERIVALIHERGLAPGSPMPTRCS